MSLLNGDFEIWSGPGVFVAGGGLINGAELADDWFYNQGSASSSAFSSVLSRTTSAYNNNSGHNTGLFSIVWSTDNTQSGVNTTTYIYQDISNYTDFLDQDVTMTCAIRAGGGSNATGHIAIDDGITVTQSSSSSGSGDWETVRVDKHISPSATYIRVSIVPDQYNKNNIRLDTAAFGLTLEINLSQSIIPSDNFATNAARENFETVLLTDHAVGLNLIEPGELNLSELMFVDDTFHTDHILLNLTDNISSTDLLGLSGYLNISSIILLNDECNTGNSELLTCSDNLTITIQRQIALADSLVLSDVANRLLPEVQKNDSVHAQDWVGLKLISDRWTN